MSIPSTSPTLLQRLRHRASPAEDWQRFVQLYTPLMQHWARRRLGLHDSDDLIQEIFAVLVQRLPEFDYDQGKSFRAWLWTVLRHKWIELQKRQKAGPQADAEELDRVVDNASGFWEADYRDHL